MIIKSISNLFLFTFIAFGMQSFVEQSTVLKWVTNYDEAIRLSKAENKTILMSFSGSDWCASCMKLEQVIFETDVFKAYAAKNLILLKLDFPVRAKNKLSKEQTEHNEELASKYNSNGQFPTVVLLNSEKEVLGVTGYKKVDAQGYIAHLSTFIK